MVCLPEAIYDLFGARKKKERPIAGYTYLYSTSLWL